MAADHHVSNDELVLYFLGGLGLEFDFVVVDLTSRDSCRVLSVASHAKSNGRQKKSQQNPPKDPLGHQIRFKTIEKGMGLSCVGFKTDLLVRAAKIEVNQVLGSPLTVSTRRRDPRTFKEMELKSNSKLVKFGLNEG